MKQYIVAAAWLIAALSLSASEPAGYYSSCNGKSGQALLKQLESVISNHTNVGYAGLWDLYKKSDIDANGKIWDMYSTKRWNPGSEQCGSYSSVGDCYNREHSMPKSWFNDASPMYSDGFHIYPTDGKVNGQRSNYPYGECSGGTTLSSSGGVKALGRLGKSTYPGYSGTVFEPDDQYKGDFARSYFYMAACYNSRISTWNSDMLAGNSYPVFTSWAKELLMKWHLEDPVSDKERARNEAVYSAQRNRNPFIDHPELAEHIWGAKSTTGWQEGGSTVVTNPVFTSPTNGSSFDMGTIAVGVNRTISIPVRGTDMTAATTVTVSGNGFSVSPATLTAAQVNAGATVTVTLKAPSAGTYSATVKLTSGSLSTSATVTAKAVAGLAASQPTGVTTDGFTAHWVNSAGTGATYQFHLAGSYGDEIKGYPVTVDAAAESYEVTGLEPDTTYDYWLTSGSEKSNVISVTTRSELPELELEPGSDLYFVSQPGVASQAVTIFIDAYHVDGDITVEVSEPFEISIDKREWSTRIILGEDDGQFYMRLNGKSAGVFQTAVRATANGAYNDDLMAEGVIEAAEPLLESFEQPGVSNYKGQTYKGDVATWELASAGVYNDSRDIHSGHQGVRFNQDANGSVTMTQPVSGGVSNVAFYSKLWPNDNAARLELHYSLDGGASWTRAASVVPGDSWGVTSADINQTGNVMLRVVKPEGGRVSIDDVAITPMQNDIDMSTGSNSGLAELWSAWAFGGSMLVNNPGEARQLSIYSLDGAQVWSGVMPSGTIVIPVSVGHYIAVSGSESRRVVVR